MKNLQIYFISLLSVLLLFNSCKKEYESIETIDDRKIQEYISKNNLSMTKDPSGFYYKIVSPGTYGVIENKDSVFFTFNYKSLNGPVYFESHAFSNNGNYLGYLSSMYDNTYPGDVFRSAIGKVQRGGKVMVIIPSYMAYGKNGNDVVPPNEIITSEITVLPQTKQIDVDDDRIQAFLTANSLTAIKHPSRVYYILDQAGTGTEEIRLTSTIKVKFTGRLLDGTVFDQKTGDETMESALAGLIRGWQKVLVGYTAGTKIRLFIPSDLGYGMGRDMIPQNTVLDFDIEIVTVTN